MKSTFVCTTQSVVVSKTRMLRFQHGLWRHSRVVSVSEIVLSYSVPVWLAQNTYTEKVQHYLPEVQVLWVLFWICISHIDALICCSCLPIFLSKFGCLKSTTTTTTKRTYHWHQEVLKIKQNAHYHYRKKECILEVGLLDIVYYYASFSILHPAITFLCITILQFKQKI